LTELIATGREQASKAAPLLEISGALGIGRLGFGNAVGFGLGLEGFLCITGFPALFFLGITQ
jgi:hypothetical protein